MMHGQRNIKLMCVVYVCFKVTFNEFTLSNCLLHMSIETF